MELNILTSKFDWMQVYCGYKNNNKCGTIIFMLEYIWYFYNEYICTVFKLL